MQLTFLGVQVDHNPHAEEFLPQQLTRIRDLNLDDVLARLAKLALGNARGVHGCWSSARFTNVHLVRVAQQKVPLP